MSMSTDGTSWWYSPEARKQGLIGGWVAPSCLGWTIPQCLALSGRHITVLNQVCLAPSITISGKTQQSDHISHGFVFVRKTPAMGLLPRLSLTGCQMFQVLTEDTDRDDVYDFGRS